MPTKDLADEQVQPPPFPEQYQSAVHGVRAAFTELLLSAGADLAKPRDTARRFDLNKNLTWMVSKIVNSTDVYSIAQHIPGPARVRSLLTAMRKGGATPAAVKKLQAALSDFDRMVEEHTGDRATLELMVSEMSPTEAHGEQLINCRKMAFKGNSGTLGVQAQVQMAAAIVAPNAADPTMADLMQLGGLFDFRRLRSSARWLLFRRMRWEDDGTPSSEPVDEPLFDGPDGSPLIPEFCSNPLPELTVVQEATETQYELPPGPVGNTAAMTCVYGSLLRATGSLYRDPHNRYMELGCSLVTPAETLVFDLLIHESMPWAMKPELGVFSQILASPDHSSPARERNRIVITERVADLGRGLSAMITPTMPRHADLLRAVFERAGWDPNEFHALRFVMSYPPIPATLLLISELPERPSE